MRKVAIPSLITLLCPLAKPPLPLINKNNLSVQIKNANARLCRKKLITYRIHLKSIECSKKAPISRMGVWDPT